MLVISPVDKGVDRAPSRGPSSTPTSASTRQQRRRRHPARFPPLTDRAPQGARQDGPAEGRGRQGGRPEPRRDTRHDLDGLEKDGDIRPRRTGPGRKGARQADQTTQGRDRPALEHQETELLEVDARAGPKRRTVSDMDRRLTATRRLPTSTTTDDPRRRPRPKACASSGPRRRRRPSSGATAGKRRPRTSPATAIVPSRPPTTTAPGAALPTPMTTPRSGPHRAAPWPSGRAPRSRAPPAVAAAGGRLSGDRPRSARSIWRFRRRAEGPSSCRTRPIRPRARCPGHRCSDDDRRRRAESPVGDLLGPAASGKGRGQTPSAAATLQRPGRQRSARWARSTPPAVRGRRGVLRPSTTSTCPSQRLGDGQERGRSRPVRIRDRPAGPGSRRGCRRRARAVGPAVRTGRGALGGPWRTAATGHVTPPTPPPAGATPDRGVVGVASPPGAPASCSGRPPPWSWCSPSLTLAAASSSPHPRESGYNPRPSSASPPWRRCPRHSGGPSRPSRS